MRQSKGLTNDKTGNARKVSRLLTILSKPGALAMLQMAGNGMRAYSDAHLHVGLSRRQYYSRLSELVKTGLVEKVGRTYLQTPFGRIVWNCHLPDLEAAFVARDGT